MIIVLSDHILKYAAYYYCTDNLCYDAFHVDIKVCVMPFNMVVFVI